EAREVRHERLDHETASGSKVTRDRLHTPDLLRLREQGEERIERDEGEREALVQRKIVERRQGDGNRRAAGFGAKLRDHYRRRINAVHLDAPAPQWKRNAACADAEFQDGSILREVGERVDRALVVRGVPRV